jgi:hypothetical protein
MEVGRLVKMIVLSSRVYLCSRCKALSLMVCGVAEDARVICVWIVTQSGWVERPQVPSIQSLRVERTKTSYQGLSIDPRVPLFAKSIKFPSDRRR